MLYRESARLTSLRRRCQEVAKLVAIRDDLLTRLKRSAEAERPMLEIGLATLNESIQRLGREIVQEHDHVIF